MVVNTFSQHCPSFLYHFLCHHLKLLRDLKVLKTTRQWDRQETHLAFWRKCQEQFKADCIGAESAYQFFLSQAEVIFYSIPLYYITVSYL